MYKVASDKRQSSLTRGRLSDWVNGEERLSGDDKLNQLRQTCQILEGRILALPAGSEERRRLGQEKQQVQLQLKKLRDDKPKAPPDWKMHFVNEAKRLLSDSQFKMIENAAKIEAAREQRKIEAKASEVAA
jgi:hypothetical protein